MKKCNYTQIKASALNMVKEAITPLLAVVFALTIGAIIIYFMGIDPLEAYRSLVRGSLGSKSAVSETLIKATPLMLTGLAFAFAFRCGLFNIGGEGQLYMGAFSAAAVGIYITGLPIYVHLPLAIAAGFLGGGLWGLLSGWLKVKYGANEIITTVMFNYVAILWVSFIVTGPFKEPHGNMPHSAPVEITAQLPRILSGTRLHLGIFIAILALIFFYVFLWHMKKGYEIRMVGQNPQAARYAGMNPERNIMLAMFLAGGMAGLAGARELLAVQHRLMQGLSPGYGFDGIAVALLGKNGPIGILLGAILFGMLRSGGNLMQMINGVPVAIIYVIQALVIIFVVSEHMLKPENRQRWSKYFQNKSN